MRGRVGRRSLGLAAVVCFALSGVTSPSGAAPALKTGKVKKIVKRQIKKIVPGMIDADTIDQAIIPPVTSSIADPNKTVLTKGPFTISLDCSDVGGNVNLKLLVRTTEVNSVVTSSAGVSGDLDPADGDQLINDYTGNPPGGEADADHPYYERAFLRSPSGTNAFVQLDSVTNFSGSHCSVKGWLFDLVAEQPSSAVAAPGVAAPSGLSAPLTTGKVKRIARKQIKKLVPGMVDAATLDFGTVAPAAADVTDPNETLFTTGPFTLALDCSLDGPNVDLTLRVATSEENSVVNASGGLIGGDLDPADGSQAFSSFNGSPPGSDAVSGDPYDTSASFRSPSGTHVEFLFDAVTNFQGNDCYVDGWFVDLAGPAPGGASAAKLTGGAGLSAPVTSGKVKKIAKRQIKKLVPGMIDNATFGQGTIPPATATVTDPNETIFLRGPFTITLDCSLQTIDIDLAHLARTTEENSAISSGWGYNEEIDPSDGDVLFAEQDGNPPGGDADTGSDLGYQMAVFHSPSGTHVYAQFDAVMNYQGNHCFSDGWFLDLAG